MATYSVVSPLCCSNLQFPTSINFLLRLLLMVIVLGMPMGATLRARAPLLSVAGCAFMWLRVDRMQVDPYPGRSMLLPRAPRATWWPPAVQSVCPALHTLYSAYRPLPIRVALHGRSMLANLFVRPAEGVG